jgi:hypothetical protein
MFTGYTPAVVPRGFHSFACTPIANYTRARFRNDVLHEEVTKRHLELQVVRRFDALAERCDLHPVLNNDCLHFGYSDYLQKQMLLALHAALM